MCERIQRLEARIAELERQLRTRDSAVDLLLDIDGRLAALSATLHELTGPRSIH